jgi:hypothetical protein
MVRPFVYCHRDAHAALQQACLTARKCSTEIVATAQAIGRIRPPVQNFP